MKRYPKKTNASFPLSIVVSYRSIGVIMGRCPNCVASSIFGVETNRCIWCGKTVCNRCVPTWHGTLTIKTSVENLSGQGAYYETVGFCSRALRDGTRFEFLSSF